MYVPMFKIHTVTHVKCLGFANEILIYNYLSYVQCLSCFRESVVGIIVAPLCWKVNEWIGLTVGCSLVDIMYALKRHTDVHIPKRVSRNGEYETYGM